MGNKVYERVITPSKINKQSDTSAFASALLLIPVTMSNFGFAESDLFINFSSLFTQGQPLYISALEYFFIRQLFLIQKKLENLRKYGGYILE